MRESDAVASNLAIVQYLIVIIHILAVVCIIAIIVLGLLQTVTMTVAVYRAIWIMNVISQSHTPHQ